VRILAIDGAFGAFSCAVTVDGVAKALERASAGTTLEMGLLAIRRALEGSGIAPSALDRIAVCTGPGSFTSLRITISYAKALALGWAKPLVGINAFDALEAHFQGVPRLAVICAREGIISVRLTLADAQVRESGRTAAVCARIAQACSGPSLTALGAPEDVLVALGERGMLVHTWEAPPPALAIAELAASRAAARTLHEVRADYGELPPAVIRS
jgi:tRNA threonylcarbamoyl adenosine modification protein YeaZ